MKHRLLITAALATLACAAVASTAAADRGGKGLLFQFRGEVVSASAGSVQLTVEGGNHAALRAMLGQAQNQAFTIGSTTEVLVWHNGIPAVGSYLDLHPSDWVQVNVRAQRGSSLAQIEATPARHVGDHEPANAPDHS